MKYIIKKLAKEIEAQLAPRGFHIALTGGNLYKEGQRKDIDLVLYTERNRDVPRNMMATLLDIQHVLPDLRIHKYYGFVIKATYKDIPVDFLYPEYTGGTYNKEELEHNNNT